MTPDLALPSSLTCVLYFSIHCFVLFRGTQAKTVIFFFIVLSPSAVWIQYRNVFWKAFLSWLPRWAHLWFPPVPLFSSFSLDLGTYWTFSLKQVPPLAILDTWLILWFQISTREACFQVHRSSLNLLYNFLLPIINKRSPASCSPLRKHQDFKLRWSQAELIIIPFKLVLSPFFLIWSLIPPTS